MSLPPSNLIPPGSKFGHTILADLDIRTLARCRETVQYLSNTGNCGSFRRTTSAFERETRVSVNIDCEASACNCKSSQVRKKKKLYKGFFVARFRFWRSWLFSRRYINITQKCSGCHGNRYTVHFIFCVKWIFYCIPCIIQQVSQSYWNTICSACYMLGRKYLLLLNKFSTQSSFSYLFFGFFTYL